MSKSTQPKYSGQHRIDAEATRPNKALAGLTTASAMLVGSVAMANAADAASASTWDKLAQCESSGNWAINSGNGFYGGLQFTPSTWKAFGGTKYASSAQYASRSEQIEIAEKVLDGQGWGAWPACSRKLGLSSRDASGTPSTSRSSQRAAAPKPTSKPAPKPVATKPNAPIVKPVPVPVSPVVGSGNSYVVRSGDTLSEIAAAQKIRGGWQALYSLNRATIGSDPDLILVGQKLELPR